MRNTYKLIVLLICVFALLASCSGNDESDVSMASENGGNENVSAESALLEETSASANEEIENSGAELSEEQSDASQEVSEDDGEFYILYTEDEVDFSKAPKAEILNYPWGKEYTPYAYGQVIFRKDDGFYVYMYCEEKNPKTTVTQIGGSVYLDSCLEFFCDYRPETRKREAHYINLEMNSKGIYLANMGGKPVKWLSDEKIVVRGKVYEDYWCVTAHIPVGLIKDVYGDFYIGEGSVVECNFTKGGSETEIPHYGTWQMLRGSKPDFHQPYFFAEVEIKRG